MDATCYTDLENETWYWFTIQSEGDTFYPVFVSYYGKLVMDDKVYESHNFKGALFYKAIMPNS